MASGNLFGLLRDIITKNGKSLRKELRENLITVLNEQKERIEQFALKNITFNPPKLGIEGLVNFELNSYSLQSLFSVTYFANSEYFRRDINLEREKVYLFVPITSENATHARRGFYEHHIEIPLKYFDLYQSLFHVMDSESRHCVHQNLLNDKGIDTLSVAKRAYHVISETIDEGVHRRIIKKTSPQFDPFLNDFEIFPEPNGHIGAKYICRHLAIHPKAKWMQLYWLSRLSIRPNITAERSFQDYINMLKNLENIIDNILPVEIKGDEEIISSIRIRSPFDKSINILLDFYSGKITTKDPVIKKLVEIRNFAIDNFPYVVDEDKGVNLNGKLITQFASQLDYVVLKLATTKPKDLYIEATRKI